MSKLEELIAELCPNGVEYKMLGEVFVQFSGMGGVSNKWANEGNCRFIDYMNAYKHVSIDVADLPFATVKKLDQNILKQGDVLFTSASETPDECAISSVIEDKIEDGIFLDDHLFGLRLNEDYNDKVSPSYLKYAFRAKSFRSQMKKAVRGVTRFYVSKSDFMRLRIPVPPLEVQREIARILDNFTFLSAELSAELQARKKQFEYYRNLLLNTNKGELVETKDIKIDSFWLMPATPKFQSNGIPYITSKNIKNGDIDFENVKYISTDDYKSISSNRTVKKNDLLITMIGTIGEAAFVNEKTEFYGQNLYLVRLDEKKVNRKYYYYYLTSPKVKDAIVFKKNASSQGYIKAGSIENMKLFLPSISEQSKIADILDRFNQLCTDISGGLPAEIETRQKQYEYYRDKLLSFRELKTEHDEQL